MFSKSHPVRISLIALLACGVFLFGAGAASGQTDDPYVGIPTTTTTTAPGFTTTTTTTAPGSTTTTATTAPGSTTTTVTTSTTVPDIDVLPDTSVPDGGNVPGGPAVLGETVTRPTSGPLPFTGGELALLVLIGVGLFAGGAVVILGSKRRQTSD